MKTVWTYYFELEYLHDESKYTFSFEMPKGAEILHCGLHEGRPCLWVLVDALGDYEGKQEIRHFASYPRGHLIPDQGESTLKYLGIIMDDLSVFHVFEVLKKSEIIKKDERYERWKNELIRGLEERIKENAKLYNKDSKTEDKDDEREREKEIAEFREKWNAEKDQVEKITKKEDKNMTILYFIFSFFMILDVAWFFFITLMMTIEQGFLAFGIALGIIGILFLMGSKLAGIVGKKAKHAIDSLHDELFNESAMEDESNGETRD